MPYVREHAVRLQQPEKYEKFRRENDKFGTGIDAIWGITHDGKVELQSLRFDAKRYTIDDVKRFIRDHNLEPLAIEPAETQGEEDASANAEPQPSLVERVARLFRVGFYPSKNVEVSESDIDKIIANSKDVPVLVEHKPTLLLGKVKELYRKGKELWGKLWLKPEAATLLDENEARSLSVAIDLNKMQLQEVSVVKTPQVADAQIFSCAETVIDTYARTHTTQQNAEEHVSMEKQNVQMQEHETVQETLSVEQFRQEILKRDARIAQLEQELLQSKIDMTVRELSEKGHLIPANRELARTILYNLMCDKRVVQFNNEDVELAQLFLQFVQSIPAPVQPNAMLNDADNIPEPIRQYANDLKRFGISNDAMNLLAKELIREGKNV